MGKGSSRRQGGRRRLITHRRMVAIEALLALGALESWAENRMMADSHLADPVKALLAMALVVGLFGAVLLIMQRWTQASLSKTHAVVQGLPLPTPVVVVHVGVLVALYFLWCWVLGLSPW